ALARALLTRPGWQEAWRRFARTGRVARPLELGDAVLRVMQRHVLDQRRLDQQVERVGNPRAGLADQRVGLGIARLPALLLQTGEKGGDQIAFLRRHGGLVLGTQVLEIVSPSLRNKTGSCSARVIGPCFPIKIVWESITCPIRMPSSTPAPVS